MPSKITNPTALHTRASTGPHATTRCTARVPASRLVAAGLVSSAALLAACAPSTDDTGSVVEESVCATGTTVEGVDVSVYQGSHIDWNAVHASGRAFAITRVNDGVSSLDPTFHTNWSGIRAAGMIRGAYQFFRPNDDASHQASIVCSALGRLGAGDLPAMLDLEVSGGQSASTIVSKLTTWLHAVEACTGKRPLIYTAGWFWNPSVGSRAFGAYPLVVAAYGPSCPTLPTGWTNWRMFQYSDGDRRYTPSTGPVPGIGQSVDRDRFNGSLADLRAFANDTPDWGAQYVGQSFPAASAGTVRVHAGQSVAAWISLRNIGARSWNSNTRLATTEPRDRASRFAGHDWVASDRPDAVSGTIANGATYRFNFTFNAPAALAPGLYHEHFGVVQEGTVWFSDAHEAGPADSLLEAVVEVLPAIPPATDAGTPTTSDAGIGDAHVPSTATDAGAGDAHVPSTATDAAAGDAHDAMLGSDAGAADVSDRDASDAQVEGGTGSQAVGGCSVRRGPARSSAFAIGAALLALATASRRRRR